MILRRISEGIKKQDWFVVFIEVMIVVVGIFIGLQVDDWNEKRKDQDLAQTYISRLIVDIEQDITDKNSALVRLALKRVAIIRITKLLEDLEAGDKEEVLIDNAGQFLIDIRRSTNFGWYAGNILGPTYIEMTNNGALALIKGLTIRNLITGYYQYFDIQGLRTQARITGYANMMYRLAPPQLMAIDQLAPAEDIIILTKTIDVQSVLKKFQDGGLKDYLNAELAFTLFMEREEKDSRDVAQRLINSLKAYLAGEEVIAVPRDTIGG